MTNLILTHQKNKSNTIPLVHGNNPFNNGSKRLTSLLYALLHGAFLYGVYNTLKVYPTILPGNAWEDDQGDIRQGRQAGKAVFTPCNASFILPASPKILLVLAG